METLYHYTIADRLIKILIDGYLKLTPNQEKYIAEPHLVWMTTSDEWDKTAFYGYPLEVLEQAGMIRISIDPYQVNLVNLDDVYRAMDCKSLLKALEVLAEKVKVNTSNWRVTDMVVPVSAFLNIELWRNNQWETIPINIR